MEIKGLQRLATWAVFFLQVSMVAYGLHQLTNMASGISLVGALFLGFVSTTIFYKFLRTRANLFEELKGEGISKIKALLKLSTIIASVAVQLLMAKEGLEFLGCPRSISLFSSVIPLALVYVLSCDEDRAIFEMLEKASGWTIFGFQAISTGLAIYLLFGKPTDPSKLTALFIAGSVISVAINLLERKYFSHFDEAITPLIEKINSQHDWYDLLLEGGLVVATPTALIYVEVATSVVALVSIGFPLWIATIASASLTSAFEYLTESEE